MLVFYCFFAVVLTSYGTHGKWIPEMENVGLYEGDMILTPEQQKSMENGYTSVSNIWPKTIYYDWAPERANKAAILNALHEYEMNTCLRFKKRTNQRDYIYFHRGNGGCSSGVGFYKGKQNVNLGDGCVVIPVVIHEVAHRLGIYHEQSRPDRDQYVTVVWENVKPAMKYNFNIAKNVNSHGTPYDYKSIMHYSGNGFSINGKPTMITKDPSMQNVIGRAPGFSAIDLIQINRMYKCDQGPPPPPPTGRPPTRGFAVTMKHHGGKCVAVDSNNELYLTSSKCDTKFTDISSGSFEVFGYNKCVAAGGGGSLTLFNFCEKYEKINVQSNGMFMIRKVGTNTCIHPKGGWKTPAEGTKLVEYPDCTVADKLKFKTTGTSTPTYSGFVMRHISNRCVAFNSNKELYLTSSNCNTRFTQIDGGILKIEGGQCVQVDSSYNLKIQSSGCNSRFKKAHIQPDGSFSIELVGKSWGGQPLCIHPQGGARYPSEGTKLVAYSTCNQERLRFTARN